MPTEQDCRFCHTNDLFTPQIFNHSGITGDCESCHSGDYVAAGARGKTDTVLHNSTNQDCGACHNTTNFADAFVDHSSPEVQNARCDSCHNGTDAIGKNNGHLPTNEDCRVCHVPGTFANAVFDHMGNSDFLMNSLSWMCREEQLISIRPKTPDLEKVTIDSYGWKRIFLLVVAFPLLILITGTTIWWKRR